MKISVTMSTNSISLREGSKHIFYMPDWFIIEDGIPPDIQIDITDADRLAGRDTILEQALDFFNQ